MTTTITYGATVITPALLIGYTAKSDSGAIVHAVLGVASPAVTLGIEKLRTGTLNMLFTTAAAAWSARASLAVPGVWTLADSDVYQIGMKFTRTGSMNIALDDSRQVWTLDVDFQEVT